MCEHCGVKSSMTNKDAKAAFPVVSSANKSPSGNAASEKPSAQWGDGEHTPNHDTQGQT